MNAIKIPNKSIIADFKEHLDLDLNQRILFTAPFGAGKSTFINDFQEEHKGEYRFIRLYPVNYAVSANEDVFELIKFDILYELMAHHQNEIKLKKEDFDFWLRMSMFMQNKADLMPLFLHIISLHETIGKPIAKFIEVIKPLVNDFKTYTKEININESDDIFSFLETFKNKKGNQYEMDATSQFIYDLVDRLKGTTLPEQEEIQEEDIKRVQKTVLVIDDLDRLDPDHIFRLFNIFSAHTHSINGENKFGFDKVIFVCDIENIQRIYAHKYGKGVDFAGYMDKFYSLKPFEFDHKEHLTNQLREIVKYYQFKNTDDEFINSDYFKNSLTGLLKVMIGERIVNLRSLIQVQYSEFYLNLNSNNKNKGSIVPSILLFKILKEIVGGINVLQQGLSSTGYNKESYYNIIPYKHLSYEHKYNLTNYEYEVLIGSLIVFQDERLFNFDFSNFDRDIKKIYIEELNVTVFYYNDSYGYTRKIGVKNIFEGNYADIKEEEYVKINYNNIKLIEFSMLNLISKAFNYIKENHEL